jgi:hypothetical protein
MLVMSATRTTSPQVRRVVLVRAAPISSRGDELVRRYRIARLRLVGREGVAAARPVPPVRAG